MSIFGKSVEEMDQAVLDHAVSAARKAEDLVTGARARNYGGPKQSFDRIAALWSAYLGCAISAQDAAAMMALLKAARIFNAPPGTTDDSWIDMIGYAMLGYGLEHQDD